MAETPIEIECLLVLDDTQIPEEIDIRSTRVVHVSSIVMKKLSGVQSIDSIEMIALFRIPSTFHSVGDDFREDDCSRWFPSANRILVLDGIQVVLLSYWKCLAIFFSCEILTQFH